MWEYLVCFDVCIYQHNKNCKELLLMLNEQIRPNLSIMAFYLMYFW